MENRNPVEPEKQKIRENMLSRLKNQSADDKITKSSKINELALKNPSFQQAGVILFYASTPLEVDTAGLIKECLRLNKKAALPVADPAKKGIDPG